MRNDYGSLCESTLSLRAQAILALYFFTPASAITIDNTDHMLTEDNARAMEEVIRARLVRREIADDVGDNAVRYILTPLGAQQSRARSEEWIAVHGCFSLTEPVGEEDPGVSAGS